MATQESAVTEGQGGGRRASLGSSEGAQPAIPGAGL